MEEKKTLLSSIWGKWWEPLRRWFYPAWLAYETSEQFYGYAQSVHAYFISKHVYISSYIGELGAQIMDFFCTISTFIVCSIFLTMPACFILYKFFTSNNLTRTHFEEKVKPFF